MFASKPLLPRVVVLSLLGVAVLAALLALPSGVSFARRSIRPPRPVETVAVGVHEPIPVAVVAPPPAPAPARRPARPVAAAAPRPFGGVPGRVMAPAPAREHGQVVGALVDDAGEPFAASIAAVPVGGGDAVYADSDSAGCFALELPPGTYTFSVYAKGDVLPEVIESLPVEAGERLLGLVVQLPAHAFEHDDAEDPDFLPDHHFDDDDDDSASDTILE